MTITYLLLLLFSILWNSIPNCFKSNFNIGCDTAEYVYVYCTMNVTQPKHNKKVINYSKCKEKDISEIHHMLAKLNFKILNELIILFIKIWIPELYFTMSQPWNSIKLHVYCIYLTTVQELVWHVKVWQDSFLYIMYLFISVRNGGQS